MNQRCQPVLCAFKTISFVLPDEIRKRVAMVNFAGRGNARVYFDPTYPHGTERFREATRVAGIGGCFLEYGVG
jgi:hypothetical protein